MGSYLRYLCKSITRYVLLKMLSPERPSRFGLFTGGPQVGPSRPLSKYNYCARPPWCCPTIYSPVLFVRGLFGRAPLHGLDLIVAHSILGTLSRVRMTCQFPLFAISKLVPLSQRAIIVHLMVTRSQFESLLRCSSDRIVCILLPDWLRLCDLSSMIFKLDDP